jgi:predicted NBD/HSP70 family sugar kinase
METIWRCGPIPRIDIARLTGMTGPHITRLTKDLEDRGLISDTVLRDGTRGQPVRPVSLAREGAYALGINFSHTFIEIGLVDLAGNLVSHEKLPLGRAEPKAIVTAARDALERQVQRTAISRDRIVGAGFSVPGDFREGSRKLHAHMYFPDLAEVDLAEAIEGEMPVPVSVENDAASAAVGERVHGAGGAYRSFLLVHVGHGIGSGLLLDGRLYRGAFGNAGMIGTLFPMNAPRPSGQDLFQTLQQARISINDFDDLDKLDLSNPVVVAWLERAGRQLSEGLYYAARILDPEAVILGGRLPPLVLEALYKHVNLDTLFERESFLPRPVVIRSRLGSYAGVVGAAAVCFFKTFFEIG